MVHALSGIGSCSQSNKGYNYSQVFSRIWLSKLRRYGFLPGGNGFGGESDMEAPKTLRPHCTALIICYAMSKPARDAIRYAMLDHSIKPIFVIMSITKETLSGRTLGAEDPELAERIMEEKIRNIEEPLEEEKDTIFLRIRERISRQLANM
ncbi:hypothetical protein PT974_02428 [Cladobotryum mycophilum]|uniref:Uncharacterized protein n=1 Tax=Cladobotryum mycophilum TaxID=491253 RepID=A0ABR0SY17_9HYPO